MIARNQLTAGGTSGTVTDPSTTDEEEDDDSGGYSATTTGGFTSDSSGSTTTSTYDEPVETADTNEVTTMDDPFSGGRTGSEVMAEAGDPSAVATIDPHNSSVQEVIEEEGYRATVQRMTDLAQDGDDPNEGAVFDFANEDALRDGAQSLAGSAREVLGGSDETVPNPENMNLPANWQLPDSASGMFGKIVGAVAAGGVGLLVLFGLALAVVAGGD